MSLLEIEEFNIATIYVDDLAESMKFYTEILGFKKDFDNGPGVCLKVDNVLSIYLEGGHAKRNIADKTAFMSICLYPKGGLKAAWEKLTKAEVKTVGEYEEFGETFGMFRIQDPSGNIIEFAGKP